MLSSEGDRRLPAIRQGLDHLVHSADPDPSAVERLRVEVHGLRGAAMVIGESRLAELADRIERAIAERIEPGTIDSPLAARLTAAVDALGEGVVAAAQGDPEPPSLAESLGSLG